MRRSSFSESLEESRANRRKNRRERILARRGAFKWLPVKFSNDLVHGSWWFVVGSVIATLIPAVPLVDLFYPFWETGSGSLPLLEDAAAFGLLIVSGFFFTLGSLAFVRATEEPAVRPLFGSWTIHLATDELLAAWLFLFGTIPFVPFMAVYVYYNPDVLVYWGSLVASVIFVIACYLFVLACYPTEEIRQSVVIPQITKVLCGEKRWIQKHLANDWLAGTWIFFYGTLVVCIGAICLLILTMRTNSTNYLEIFDWASTTIDSIIFLIGSAYFCAGSYPQEARSEHRADDKNIYRKGDRSFDHYDDAENAPLLSQGPPKQDGNDGKRS